MCWAEAAGGRWAASAVAEAGTAPLVAGPGGLLSPSPPKDSGRPPRLTRGLAPWSEGSGRSGAVVGPRARGQRVRVSRPPRFGEAERA